MKKKYSFSALLVLLAMLLGPMARGQAPAWQMVLAATSSNTANAYGTAADASGNVYVVGGFTGTLTLGGKTVTTAGISDIFIAKWNATSAAFEWVTRAGGLGYDEARAVAVSTSGIYVTGFTQSALINFGPSTLSPVGGSDVFVAKISSTGTFVWALQAGGTNTDEAYAIAASGASVYVGGHSTSSTNTFGNINVANAAPSRATDDGFVAKITDVGSSAAWTWARGVGGPNNDSVGALAVQGSSVYAAGTFLETAAFGALSLTAAAPGLNDVFVVKFTDAGSTTTPTWALRAGGAKYDYATALAVEGNRVYVGGLFTSATAGFGNTTLTNGGASGSDEGFVAKITDAGSSAAFGWAVRMGGDNDDQVTGLVATASGPCASGFYYSGPATFGSSIMLQNYLLRGGSADAFVTQLADNGSTGTVAWAQRAGGTGTDFGYALALSGSTLYTVGSVVPQAIFTPLSIDAPVGSRIPFVAALPLTTLPLAAAAPAAPGWLVALVPNPASGTATAVLPALAGAGPATLTLLDALGRPVLVRTVALPAQVALPLHGLPAGVYALRVQAGATVATQRLVIE